MSNRVSRGAAVGALMAVVVAMAPEAFAQVCVNPAGGGCQPTIQDGVDLATAGQTVTVQPAVYTETVVIPVGKDGLKVVGDGAIVDNPSNENSFEVLSNDVTISGFLIRNGKHGIFVGDDVSVIPHGTIVDGVSFDRTLAPAVYLAGADGTTITDCRFTAITDPAVSAKEGPDAAPSDFTTVTRCRFTMGRGAVSIVGNDAVVSGNKFTKVDGRQPIHVQGDRAQVVKNSLTRSSGGVFVDGGAPVVTGNKVSGFANRTGVEVTCQSDCPNGLVSGNKVASAPDDEAGFMLYGLEAGLVVTKNSSASTANEGFYLSGIGIHLTGNRVSKTGGDDYESGIEVYGENHVVTGNTVSTAMSAGIYVEGTGHVVTGNTVSDDFGDGVQFYGYSGSSNSAAISENSASGNISEGFSVMGDSEDYSLVVFTGNTTDGNRTPFCSQAPLVGATDGGGNTFTVAGAPDCVTAR